MLSPKKRIALMEVILLLILNIAFTAMAASGISFSNHTPANGAVTGAARPVVGVDVYAAEGSVTESDVQMSLDGTPVTPSLSAGGSPGTYNISYAPAADLADSSHTVAVSIYDTVSGNSTPTNWSFTVDADPNATSLAPGEGSTINSTGPQISAAIKDIYDNLDANSVGLKIDGIAVPAVFKFQGYDSYDSCTGEYLGYVITSYKDGTVSYQSANLTDGVHTVELSISDVAGNVLNKQWSFTVGTKPAFSGFTPADGTQFQSVTGISVKVTDANNNLDPATIVLKDNGTVVGHTYDPATGTISYNNAFSYGLHTISVSAGDTAGNTGTAGWSFTVDNQPPAVTLTGGGFADGMTITNGTLRFTAELNDLVDISGTGSTPDVVLKLDGNPLPAGISYEMNVDSCTGEILGVKSKKKVYVNYESIIADGPHTLTLTGSDILGNALTKNWSFTVVTKPTISEWTPVTRITGLSPTISVKAVDVNTGINPADIFMTFNGQTVTPNYDAGTSKITYSPGQLANESYHTVTLKVYDLGGLSSDISWKFYTNTYPDMADSNIGSCTACHSAPDSPFYNGPFETIHASRLSFSGNHSNNDCDDCHNYITQPDQCGQCHPFDTGIGDGSGPHGTSPGISYGLKNADAFFPLRVIQNREMWDCAICHQPGAGVPKESGAPLNNHDIPELHKTAESSCSSCHALSLTREHARAGRYDPNRLAITCNTCHQSVDLDVQNAVTTNNKNCSSCHSNPEHNTDGASSILHATGLDVDCQTCHKAAADQEHTNNLRTKTTAGTNYTCETCHGSANMTVQDAIYNKNPECTACHTVNHDMPALHTSIYTDPKILDCSICHNNRLDTYHDGKVSSTTGLPMDCGTCHNNDVTDVKAAISGQNTRCDACHEIHSNVDAIHDSGFVISPAVNCAGCHTDIINIEHSSRISSTTGLTMDCATCHNSADVAVAAAIYGDNSKCDACHVIHPELAAPHSSIYTDPLPFDCSSCHLNRLDTEHSGKFTDTGLAINCNTCHDSGNQAVQTAVYNQNTRCDACHTIHDDVSAAHSSGFVLAPVVSCAQCHNEFLDMEHLNGKYTSTSGYTCATCHDSVDATVSGAIYNNNNKCDACHSIHPDLATPHTSTYTDPLPFKCSDCHLNRLDTEHSGKFTDAGTAINCNTCHTSSTPAVQTAVYTPNTRCDACHTVHNDVSAVHIASLSYGCSLCHTSSLITNHGSNCSLCHDSAKPEVKTAIALNNKNCSACHVIHPNTSHKSEFVKDKKFDCSGCHSENLATEHEKRGLLCETCHKTDVNKVNYAVNTQNRYCNACHTVHEDITTVHTAAFPEILPVKCDGCHNKIISDEHTAKLNSKGEKMTCNTCHGVIAPQTVKDALRNKKTGCTACHSIIHEEIQITQKHLTTFEAAPAFACIGCHQSSLDKEHAGTKKNCNTCHDNQKPQVVTSIKEKKAECKVCHTTHPDAVQAHWKFDAEQVQCRDCHAVHRPPAWGKPGSR